MSPSIRPASPADAGAIAAIYAPFVTDSAVSFELEPPGAHEMRRRIERGQLRYPWLVADDGGEVAGYAYATEFRSRPAYQWSAEVSVYLAEGHRGKGLGRALIDALLTELEGRGIVTVPCSPQPASSSREPSGTSATSSASGTASRSSSGRSGTESHRPAESGRAAYPGPLGVCKL